jgi:hypothetical protein
MDFPNARVSRRIVIPAAGLSVVGAGLLHGLGDGPSNGGSTIELAAVPDSVVRSATVPLRRGRQLSRVPGAQGWQTRQLRASTFKMMALTWRGDADAVLHIRTRTDRRWGDWREIDPQHDLPDDGEGTDTRGTQPLWVGTSDGVQVRVTGGSPRDLELVLIDPGMLPADRTAAASEPVAARSSGAPPPRLLWRKDWGANESWRDGGPYLGTTIKQVHVHHTVTGNRYSPADVPALIRGMYRYHTHNLGWSDIGYNFLVDKWGRTWVGRFGDVQKPVRGAHTRGFNNNSVGVAVIGNYQTARVTDAVARSVAKLAAWKLDRYGRRPLGEIWVLSAGSDRYPAGQAVKLPVIDGHRATNHTACPGRYLVGRLQNIRWRAQWWVDRY